MWCLRVMNCDSYEGAAAPTTQSSTLFVAIAVMVGRCSRFNAMLLIDARAPPDIAELRIAGLRFAGRCSSSSPFSPGCLASPRPGGHRHRLMFWRTRCLMKYRTTGRCLPGKRPSNGACEHGVDRTRLRRGGGHAGVDVSDSRPALRRGGGRGAAQAGRARAEHPRAGHRRAAAGGVALIAVVTVAVLVGRG